MDEEMSLILRRLLLAFIVAVIFCAPVIVFVYNKFDNGTSDIFGKIKNKEKVLIFVDGYKCDACKDVKKILKDYNVDYYKINKDTENQNYRIILDKINLNEEFVDSPTLILVEDGKLNLYINDFSDENLDLEEFFVENNLIR